MKRTLAWIGIIVIALGFLALVYFTATGASSSVIFATLFVMLVFPIIIYGLMMASKWFDNRKE